MQCQFADARFSLRDGVGRAGSHHVDAFDARGATRQAVLPDLAAQAGHHNQGGVPAAQHGHGKGQQDQVGWGNLTNTI